jgi:hypothetical protein
MAHAPGTPKTPGSGRKRGTPNKRTLDGEAWARAIVDDPQVRKVLLEQARAGILPTEILRTLLAYAFGKPPEVMSRDDGSETRSITITF